jgi:hypothetical protein
LSLYRTDQKIAAEASSWENLAVEIQTRMISPSSSKTEKRQMAQIQPLPQVLGTLRSMFMELVHPFKVRYDILWGLIYLNLRLSYPSKDNLKRTTNFLLKLRRSTELFNRCLEVCEEDNEKRIAIVDFLDPVTVLLSDSINFIYACQVDPEAESSWPDVNESINQQFDSLDFCVKHVNDITQFSKINRESNIKNMSLKHAVIADNDEHGIFPNKLLPFAQNPKFYGRKEEIQKMIKHLSVRTEQSYRTYTIYGSTLSSKSRFQVFRTRVSESHLSRAPLLILYYTLKKPMLTQP